MSGISAVHSRKSLYSPCFEASKNGTVMWLISRLFLTVLTALHAPRVEKPGSRTIPTVPFRWFFR